MPELVEKKEPPMITIIKYMKYKFEFSFEKKIPMLETELHIDNKQYEKFFSLKNIKNIKAIKTKYTNK